MIHGYSDERVILPLVTLIFINQYSLGGITCMVE